MGLEISIKYFGKESPLSETLEESIVAVQKLLKSK
jgi:hypothetical protein